MQKNKKIKKKYSPDVGRCPAISPSATTAAFARFASIVSKRAFMTGVGTSPKVFLSCCKIGAGIIGSLRTGIGFMGSSSWGCQRPRRFFGCEIGFCSCEYWNCGCKTEFCGSLLIENTGRVAPESVEIVLALIVMLTTLGILARGIVIGELA